MEAEALRETSDGHSTSVDVFSSRSAGGLAGVGVGDVAGSLHALSATMMASDVIRRRIFVRGISGTRASRLDE